MEIPEKGDMPFVVIDEIQKVSQLLSQSFTILHGRRETVHSVNAIDKVYRWR